MNSDDAASTDPAAEAYQKGRASLDKQDYDAAIAAFTEGARLDPKSARTFCGRVLPTRRRATTTRPSPTTTRPFGSTRKTPLRIPTVVLPARERATMTGPSPTTMRRFGSTRKTPNPTTAGASPMGKWATTTRPLPTSRKPFASIPRRRSVLQPWHCPREKGRTGPGGRRLH